MADLIPIIKDYQYYVNSIADIFKTKFQVNDIMQGWYTNVYPGTGSLPDEGISHYQFHGLGLEVYSKEGYADFDFWYIERPDSDEIQATSKGGGFSFEKFFPPRLDGFNLWLISKYIQNQRVRYPDYTDIEKIRLDFNNLIKSGTITKPKYAGLLYFFTDTVDHEMIDPNSRNTTDNESLIQDFLKLTGFKSDTGRTKK